MKRFSKFMSVAFVVLVSAAWAQAQKPGYDFVTIDPPGSVGTFLKSNNSQGDMLGDFVGEDGQRHGYLLSGGTFHELNFCESTDGTVSTVGYANGMNSHGEIVAGCPNSPSGYLLSRGRVIKIDFPGAAWTASGDINDAGNILGIYGDSNNTVHGFLLSDGQYTQIDFPAPDVCETFPNGINDVGDIVGEYRIGPCDDSNGEYRGFFLSHGTFSTIAVPDAVGTIPVGINAQGDVVGSYIRANGDVSGFVMRKGIFTTLQFPGALLTGAADINARGWIVGDYRDANWVRHGFLAVK